MSFSSLVGLNLLLGLYFAGCLSSPEASSSEPTVSSETPNVAPSSSSMPWQSDACDPSGATTLGRNAPRAVPFSEHPIDVVERVLEAIDDSLLSKEPLDQHQHWKKWQTRNGEIQYDQDANGIETYTYMSNRIWPSLNQEEAEDRVNELLRTIGVPASVAVESRHVSDSNSKNLRGSVWEVHQGKRVGITESRFEASGNNAGSPTGEFSSFTMVPLYDLSSVSIDVPREEAQQTAEAYLRCVLDREDLTEEAGYRHTGTFESPYGPFHVRYESLAHAFGLTYTEPAPSHCGFSRIVLVDVETGVVNGWLLTLCD